MNDALLEQIPTPNRVMAPFVWFGGKGNLAKKIIPLLPKAITYVEPYAGAASVFWHLPQPYPVEVLNDLDGRIVNLFRVLQDRAKFEELAHRLVWTPYARAEFRRARAILQDPDASDIDRAWAFFVVHNQGFSGLSANSDGDWGRSLGGTDRGMATTTNRWRGRLKLLAHWHDRLTRVQIDSTDALECIQYWDTPDTLFYIDPPYVLETRKGGGYTHEADDQHHQALVRLLLNIQGKAVLSGYDHPTYKPLEDAGWHKKVIPTVSHAVGRVRGSGLLGKGAALAKVPRFEVIWDNIAPTRSLPLFDYDPKDE